MKRKKDPVFDRIRKWKNIYEMESFQKFNSQLYRREDENKILNN